MAREKLPPPLLENMIHEILSELSKDDCYPTGMQKAFLDCTGVKVSHDHVIYKECIKCLAFMYKKSDPEKFYEKFYSSLPLQAETLLNKTFRESLCKVIVLHLGDKLLTFSKPSSRQSCVEISLKDAERGPLNYLGGYILRNLYRKHLSKASKKTNICQEKEEFIALLDSLHVDDPVAKDTAFISAKDRGGLCYPKEYLRDIFVAAELQFRVHTGKEVCHKICGDKIVDILLQFLCKGHRPKIQNSAKGNQKERLEERNQKGHESKCAGLMFHHFFHHQRIFEGLMQRMMSSQSFNDTNKVQNVFKGNNLHQHLISSFYSKFMVA